MVFIYVFYMENNTYQGNYDTNILLCEDHAICLNFNNEIHVQSRSLAVLYIKSIVGWHKLFICKKMQDIFGPTSNRRRFSIRQDIYFTLLSTYSEIGRPQTKVTVRVIIILYIACHWTSYKSLHRFLWNILFAWCMHNVSYVIIFNWANKSLLNQNAIFVYSIQSILKKCFLLNHKCDQKISLRDLVQMLVTN